jgi:hypothetical protein
MANKRKDHPTASDEDDDIDQDDAYIKQCIDESIAGHRKALLSVATRLQVYRRELDELPGRIEEGVLMHEDILHKIEQLQRQRQMKRKRSKPSRMETKKEEEETRDFKLWIHFSSDPSKQQPEEPYRLSLTGPVGVFTDGMWDDPPHKTKPRNLDDRYDSVRIIECPAKDRIWLTAFRDEWIPKVLDYLDGEVVFLPKPIAGLIVEYWDAKPATRLARIQPESIGIGGPVMELEVYDEDGKLLASNQEDSPDAIFVEYNPRLLIDISADYPPVQYYRPVIQT